MAKFLLIFCLAYLAGVEGQPCMQLPSQSSITSELAAAAGLPSVDLVEVFHNCIVYGEAIGNSFTKTTVTGKFTPGTIRTGQIIYMCDGGVWIPTDVTLDTGLVQNVEGGCSDCNGGIALMQTCTGALLVICTVCICACVLIFVCFLFLSALFTMEGTCTHLLGIGGLYP